MSLITFAMKNTLTDVLGHDGGNEMSSSRNRPNERTLTEDEMRTQKPSRRSELVVSWCWECSRQSGSTPNHAGRYTWDAAAPLVRTRTHTLARISYMLCRCSRRHRNRLQMFRGW